MTDGLAQPHLYFIRLFTICLHKRMFFLHIFLHYFVFLPGQKNLFDIINLKFNKDACFLSADLCGLEAHSLPGYCQPQTEDLSRCY